MARNKFDPNAAFKNIIKTNTETEELPGQETIETLEEGKFLPDPEEREIEIESEEELETTEPTIKVRKKPGKKPSTDEKLIQRAYYITEKQSKALKLQTILGDEKDMSAIVRAALDIYLADVLNTIK